MMKHTDITLARYSRLDRLAIKASRWDLLDRLQARKSRELERAMKADREESGRELEKAMVDFKANLDAQHESVLSILFGR